MSKFFYCRLCRDRLHWFVFWYKEDFLPFDFILDSDVICLNFFSTILAELITSVIQTSVFFVPVFRNKRLVAIGIWVRKNLYHLDIEAIPPAIEESLLSVALISISTWHRRFEHVNYGTIQKMASSSLVIGLNLDVTKANLPPCEACAYGKIHQKPFPTDGLTRGKAVGDQRLLNVGSSYLGLLYCGWRRNIQYL